jgi:hypothetical protein
MSTLDRWHRILVAAEAAGGGANPNTLCTACAAVLGVAGVGITLMDPLSGAAGYASDPVSRRLEELQFTLGEGPGADAYRTGLPVAGPDLATIAPGKLVGFSGPALNAGVGGVFSFPLQIGAARVGTLTLYRAATGELPEELNSDGLVSAEMISRLILGWQAEAHDGRLARELGDDAVYQAVVHQASGMISVQLDITVGEALAVLRARSFADSRTVSETAADVVGRRLWFD